MGVVYSKQDQLQDALDSYKHALRLKPDYAEAYYNMGVVYENQDQLQDALDSYKHALRLKPDYAKAYYQYGCCLRRSKISCRMRWTVINML